MKKILMSLMLMPMMALAIEGWTDPETGVLWYFMIVGDGAILQVSPSLPVIPRETVGAIEIPSTLGGCPVTSIGSYAFEDCSGLTSVTIPSSVTSIGSYAFRGCSGLTSVTIPSSVTSVGYRVFDGCSGLVDEDGFVIISGGLYGYYGNAKSVTIPSNVTSIGFRVFYGYSGLTSVTIPSSVTSIGSEAFSGCSLLKDVYFKGVNPPMLGATVFNECDPDLVLHAPTGWKGRTRILGGVYLEVEGEHGGIQQVNVTVTNVVVNYVLNSVQPEFAIPATSDTGFVNIITEVRGGAVAVPASWADNYPTFTTKFGSDFTKALSMKTGKKDGAGNDMFVWQDYVAGTDPTKEDDVFKASITIVGGKVTISYSPELDDERKAMRKYTTWGKRSLLDTDWTVVQEGQEAEYNFFKVSVEMK